MSKVHRDLFDRLGPPPVPAVLLDTPFGFQENAGDIAARAVAYFRESVQRDIEVASYRRHPEGDGADVAHETMLARLRAAAYVFSGPGSPSYALAQWRGTQVPKVLASKLQEGGCLTFASAAAVTLGPFALPVYEIYKVGQDAHWLEGLDLLRHIGLPAVVIPHFNNTEGGNHDTRFCYMGERRLSVLERMLPAGAFILGVDEHSACIFDLDAGTVTVLGLGAVTVRREGAVSAVPSGTSLPITELVRMGLEGGGGTSSPQVGVRDLDNLEEPPGNGGHGHDAGSPLLASGARLREAFAESLARGDATRAVEAILEMEGLIAAWSQDTLQSDHLDRMKSELRSMVIRLGDAAQHGLRDPRELVRPFVTALLDIRRQARDERRWADADAIRHRLAAAGVELKDTESGTEWDLA